MKNKNSNSKFKRKENPFSLRLPKDYIWKVLNALHDDLSSFLTDKDNERISLIIRTRDITSYMSLSEDWGLQSMNNSDASIPELRARYQLASLMKKFLFSVGDSRKSAAIDTFLATEDSCRAYNLSGFKALTASKDTEVVNAYTYAISFVQKVIGLEPDLSTFDRSRHGPGASLDSENSLVSQYHKFENWPYSVSSRAFGHGVALISSDKRWLGALEDDYRQKNNICCSRILNWRTFWHAILEMNNSNKIAFVPKSYKTDRTIAIEPTMNLFLQLGVDGFIRNRLKRWDIDLDDQTKNQNLAKQASISDDFATIDLKAASDSISLRVCEALLPPDWYTYLLDLRSPYGDLDGKSVNYQKISSMGNGYTFALESLIFSSIVYGTLRTLGLKTSLRDCAIYGDDLIIPSIAFPLFSKMLTACGFRINADKSFTQGPVRESCGADWFRGLLVRPVFFSETPKMIPELFCDYNRLKRVLDIYWGITSDESKCLKLIMSWIPERYRSIRGPYSDESFDSHIHTLPDNNCRTKSGSWKHKVIVAGSRQVKANKFHFRKLMAYLRPTNRAAMTSTRKGSVFEVTKRQAVWLTQTYSSSLNWKSEYAAVPVTKTVNCL